jgi:phage-related protein
VDDWNYNWLNQWKWRILKGKNTYYVVRLEFDNMVYMHRELLSLLNNDLRQGDHVDGNGLHNYMSNLRIVSASQNAANRRKFLSRSGYKGVYWNKPTSKWLVQICVNYKKIHLGLYEQSIDAAVAYDLAALKYFGEFACLNFPRYNYE